MVPLTKNAYGNPSKYSHSDSKIWVDEDVLQISKDEYRPYPGRPQDVVLSCGCTGIFVYFQNILDRSDIRRGNSRNALEFISQSSIQSFKN